MPAKKKVPQPEAIQTPARDPEPEITEIAEIPSIPETTVIQEPAYYDHLLREIPPRRNFGDRLYQIGRLYRVTSGAAIDAEIELEWPEDAS